MNNVPMTFLKQFLAQKMRLLIIHGNKFNLCYILLYLNYTRKILSFMFPLVIKLTNYE
jgi:hypothetical protein